VRKIIIVISVVVALMLVFSSTAVLAAPPEKVNVIIGFDRQPGPSEEGLVRGVGGNIKFTYSIVPAIAASVPETAIPGLLRNPRVTVIEPDVTIQAIDETVPWGVSRIGADTVHQSGIDGSGIKIAVLDSGIDYTHPDLASIYAGGYDFVNGDNDPMDDYGHGTHVAGTIAAVYNDAGVVGVAPGIELYALKVLDSDGYGSYSSVIAALQWATGGTLGGTWVHITNNSYGSSENPGLVVEAAFLLTYYFDGVLNVAAAGNSGNILGTGDSVEYPAKFDSVIAVAATDKNDNRARWSSTGPDVELAAPGVRINSTLLGGGYGQASGTSMASPHVAGAAALVMSSGMIKDTSGNGFICDEVRQRLIDTAYDLGIGGPDNLYGHGLVDAEAAALGSTPPLPPPPPPPPPSGDMKVSSIDMSLKTKNAGRHIFVWATAIVKVVDAEKDVEGATVYGHWENATSDTDSGTTDSSGQVSLDSNKLRNPASGTTFKFVVDDVVKEGMTWDDVNSQTEASITY